MEHFWSWVIIGMSICEMALAVWVFLKDKKSAINQFFSLFTLALAGWTLINSIEVLLFPKWNINWWDRFLFLSAYAASFFLFQFTQVYPVPQKQKVLNIISWAGFIVISLMLLFTNLLIDEPHTINANLQIFYPIYIIGFLMNWTGALYLLWRSRKVVIPMLKRQVNLLLIAFICGSLLGMFTSFIAPYFKLPNISQLWPPGVAFIIFIFSVWVLRIAYKRDNQVYR